MTKVICQISVFLENKSGSLAEMARYLAKRSISLRAMSLAETRDFGTVRLIVADTDACEKALKEADYHFIESNVLAIVVTDKAGGMADILEIIAQEHVNVEYAYSMIESKKGSAIIILRVDDPIKATTALIAKKVKLLSQEDIAAL